MHITLAYILSPCLHHVALSLKNSPTFLFPQLEKTHTHTHTKVCNMDLNLITYQEYAESVLSIIMKKKKKVGIYWRWKV